MIFWIKQTVKQCEQRNNYAGDSNIFFFRELLNIKNNCFSLTNQIDNVPLSRPL